MTNGEKIKEIFPSMIVCFTTESQIGIYFVKNQHNATVFSLDFWNAEYKELITKNDLRVETTQMIDKSNFSQEQYKADLQSAYDCGYAQAKNDLGVDCISRADAIKAMQNKAKKLKNEDTINGLCGAVAILYEMPSVTPQNQVYPLCEDCRTKMDEVRRAYDNAMKQESQSFKWCTDCREYDTEKHCCHRWSKVIRDTVEEMKQEYIEREVLDKIRAEIEKLQKMCDKNDLNLMAQYSAFGMVLDILDKYKAESEE